MRYFILFAVLFLGTTATAHNREPITEQDYDTVGEFGIGRLQLRSAFRGAKNRTPWEKLSNEIKAEIENERLAPQVDKAVKAIIDTTVMALRHKGYKKDADAIEQEFYDKFDGFVTNHVSIRGDIGDYAPWSQFLADVHEKAHDRLGDVLCKFIHVHDLFIVTYSVPVVFSPSDYDLQTYQNHFTGIHVLGPVWEHYGLAPVIVYWTVNIACNVGTYAAGAAFFGCSILASVAEDAFGIYVSPKLGEFCWKKGQSDLY